MQCPRCGLLTLFRKNSPTAKTPRSSSFPGSAFGMEIPRRPLMGRQRGSPVSLSRSISSGVPGALAVQDFRIEVSLSPRGAGLERPPPFCRPGEPEVGAPGARMEHGSPDYTVAGLDLPALTYWLSISQSSHCAGARRVSLAGETRTRNAPSGRSGKPHPHMIIRYRDIASL